MTNFLTSPDLDAFLLRNLDSRDSAAPEGCSMLSRLSRCQAFLELG